MRPNIETLITTLKRNKGEYVPLIELGIDQSVKEKFLDRPLLSLKDDVDFWKNAGYDYIKLQPIADFNPSGLNTKKNITKTSLSGLPDCQISLWSSPTTHSPRQGILGHLQLFAGIPVVE